VLVCESSVVNSNGVKRDFAGPTVCVTLLITLRCCTSLLLLLLPPACSPAWLCAVRYSHQQLDVEFITQLTEACFTLISRKPVSKGLLGESGAAFGQRCMTRPQMSMLLVGRQSTV
jgi:hypothetical protein